MCSMGHKDTTSSPIVERQIKEGASAKKLDSSIAHKTDTIACFRNSKACVGVDATKLERWLNSTSSHVDFMYYVTAAILKLSASKNQGKIQTEGLNFVFLRGTLPESSKDVCTIIDPEETEETVRSL